MYREYKELLSSLKAIEKELKDFANTSNEGRILLSIPGVGVICASAFAASIDKGQAFNSAREFAVWMGLTPKQTASGDNSRMGGITKRGDRYLRKQLVHGSRAILPRCKDKDDALKVWGQQILLRKGYNKASVAMAHRLARLIWTLLQKQQHYQPQPAINKAH
jgi:transposase